MALGDASTEQHFAFPTERVFPALVAVLPSLGFGVTSADQVIGRVTATAGVSAFSYGESMAIQVRRVDSASCTLVIQSTLKVGANWAGAKKNADNAERVIAAVSRNLQGLDAASADPATEAQIPPAPPQSSVVPVIVTIVVALVVGGLVFVFVS